MLIPLALTPVRLARLTVAFLFAAAAGGAALAQTGTLTSGDIGGVSAGGSASESSGVFTVRGSGGDIWDATDEFFYHRRAWTGDGVFLARVSNVTNLTTGTHAWAKAGIMLRSTLAADSPHFLAAQNGGGYPTRIYRPVPGNSFATTALETEDRAATRWLKLIREGNVIAAFYSADGVTWRTLGAQTTSLPASVFVGLAVTSHDDGTLLTATFDNAAFLPHTPTELAAAVRGPTQIDLTWRDNSFRETSFELERSSDGVNFARIAVVSPNNANNSLTGTPRLVVSDRLTYSDTTVVAGTSYHYRVRHISPAGPSAYSAPATATTAPPAPTAWQSRDIGSPAPAGTVVAEGTDGLRITGGGAGVGGVDFHHESTGRGDFSYTVNGASDSFHFVYRDWSGDGEIVARFAAPGGTTNAQGGIMIRNGLEADARHIFLHRTAAGDMLLTARTGHSTDSRFSRQTETLATRTAADAPAWCKLVRAGAGLIAYTSADGVAWTEWRYISVPMLNTIQLGLAVSSRQSGSAATAAFQSIALRAPTTPLPTPAAPTNLAGTGSYSSVALSWTNNAPTYDWFDIQYTSDGVNFASATSTAPTGTTVRGLIPDTTYTFRVRAVRAGVPSGFSNSITASTYSGAPSNLTATAVSSWRIELAWTDNASDETGFRINRWNSTSGVSFNLPANSTSYSDVTVSPSTTYTYEVVAINSLGSHYSGTVQVTTPAEGSSPPAAPSGLAATVVSSSQINLTWTDNATTESGYSVDRSTDGTNFSPVVSLPADATSYANTGLLAGETYHFRVRATLGSVTSTPSNIATATTTAGGTPGNWTHADVGPVAAAGSYTGSGSSFTVRGSGADIWESADEFSFLHQSWTGDGTFVARAVSLDYTHGWAKAGIMLRESLAPNARHVFIAIAAGQPAGLYARTTTGGSTALTLTGIEAKPVWVMLGRAGNTYQAQVSSDGANWTPVGSPVTLSLPPTILAGLAVTSHNDGTLAHGAFDNVAFTGATGPTPIEVAAPSNLRLDGPPSSIDLTVAWTDNAMNEGGFEIERSSDGTTFARVGTRAANTSRFTDTGLTPSTTYHYRVRATLSASVSDFSNVLTVTTAPPPGSSPPAAPSGLTATVVSSTQVRLNWIDNASDETGFQAEYSTDGTSFTLFSNALASPTTHFAGPPAGVTYYYRVRAVRQNSQETAYSAYSNIASATGPSAPPPGESWIGSDIGTVAATGSSSESGATVTVTGSGRDIWNFADAFHFRHRGWTGDFIFTARVTSLTNTNPWAKAGLMFRESLIAGAPNAMMCVTAEHGTLFQNRSSPGGESTGTGGFLSSALPRWIRLQRQGGTLSGYESLDGVTWTLIGQRWLYYTTPIYIGFAVTSHNDGTLATATFDNVSLTGTGAPPPAPTNFVATAAAGPAVQLSWTDNATDEVRFELYRRIGETGYTTVATLAPNVTSYTDTSVAANTTYQYSLRVVNGSGWADVASNLVTIPPDSPPPPTATWQQTDVGTVGLAGSNESSGNTITLRGSGADIWNTADAFRFLYRVLSGDCTVEAQVSALTPTHAWAKAGVMIRGSLAANAPNAFALVTAGNGSGAQFRSSVGATTSFSAGPWGSTAPYWVRLRRSGNTITASTSPDGITWTVLTTTTLALPTEVYVGFAVTAHDNAQLATATFTDPFIE